MANPHEGNARPPDSRGHTGSLQVNSLVRLLEREPGPRSSRILSLGVDAWPLALALRNRGHEVVELRPEESDDALGGIARSSFGTFDAVLALGFVEHLRWDRWALQRIHRALKDDGTLLLVVPDLYSIRSLVNPRYVAAKLAKLLSRGERIGAGQSTSSRARDAIRSYPRGRLQATLERLGFEPLRWSGLGMQSSRGLAAGATWLPTHHLVLARKRSGIPDPEAATRRFEAENRTFLTLRDRWRREHVLEDGAPSSLEPERFAGAHILALAPHPDDEIIGCGGTLLRLVRAGAKVTVLQATDGSASAALEGAPPATRRTTRLDEARAVAEAAGFEPTIFWGEDNHTFRARDDLVARLREILRELAPALLFTPFIADIHADHLTLNRILAGALDGLPERSMSVVGYEVWSLAPANLWCDISSCMREVERLLLLYETAMKVDDFIHMCSTRDRFHALTLGGAPGYAEAFFATDAARFQTLMARAPRAGTAGELSR